MGESRRKRLAGFVAPTGPDLPALMARAKLHQHSRELAPAVALYQAVLQADPAHAEASHFLGLAILELGQYEIGVGHIQRSITLAPHEPLYHYNLGRARLLAGAPAEALASFAEAARLKPDYALAHYQRATILEALGELDAAAAAFRAAANADPALLLAQVGLARLLYRLDDIPEAMAALERAARLDPKVLDDGRIGFAHASADPGVPLGAREAARIACRSAWPGHATQAIDAAVDARELAVVDDFLDDPIAYRDAALALHFADRSHAAVNYPGIQTRPQVSLALMQRLADTLGRDIKWGWPDNGSFRLSFANSQAKSDIHVDDAQGRPTYAGVLYLSLPEHCAGGTSFWRHRTTGWEHAPSQAEAEAAGFRSFDDFERRRLSGLVNTDFAQIVKGRDKWEQVLEVPMRFNRLILYRAEYYHSISAVFGDANENARLVQLFFFERLGGGESQSSSPSS